MKKIILISFLILSCSLFYGQGSSNLGFSQVKLVGTTTETVPTGKVWKITNVLPSQTNSNSSVLIKVNGNNIEIISNNRDQDANQYTDPSISSMTILNGAIWLPANTDLQASDNCQYISVVEFNIE